MSERISQLLLHRGAIDLLLRRLNSTLNDTLDIDSKFLDIYSTILEQDRQISYTLVYKDVNIVLITTNDNILVESIPIQLYYLDYNLGIDPCSYLDNELIDIRDMLLTIISKYNVHTMKDTIRNVILHIARSFYTFNKSCGKFTIIKEAGINGYLLVFMLDNYKLRIPVTSDGIYPSKEINVTTYMNTYDVLYPELDDECRIAILYLIITTFKDHKFDWLFINRESRTFESLWTKLEKIFV